MVKISRKYQYNNNIFLEITSTETNISENHFEKNIQGSDVYLYNNKLKIINKYTGLTKYIKDDTENNELMFNFQIYNKEIEPIDVSVLTDDELLKLLDNKQIYTSEKNMQNTNWTILDAYENLKRLYTDKTIFNFNLLSYKVEKV